MDTQLDTRVKLNWKSAYFQNVFWLRLRALTISVGRYIRRVKNFGNFLSMSAIKLICLPLFLRNAVFWMVSISPTAKPICKWKHFPSSAIFCKIRKILHEKKKRKKRATLDDTIRCWPSDTENYSTSCNRKPKYYSTSLLIRPKLLRWIELSTG